MRITEVRAHTTVSHFVDDGRNQKKSKLNETNSKEENDNRFESITTMKSDRSNNAVTERKVTFKNKITRIGLGMNVRDKFGGHV